MMKTNKPIRRRMKFFGAGQPEVILNKAINTIGPDRKFVSWMACTNAEMHYPPTDKDLKEIDVSQWLKICSFLGLRIESLSVGYSRFSHLKGLFEKIASGTYIFPRNKHYLVIKRAYKRFKKESIEFEKMHYGRRLYFKIRLKEFRSSIVNFPVYAFNLINSNITLLLSQMTYRRLIAVPMAHREIEGHARVEFMDEVYERNTGLDQGE